MLFGGQPTFCSANISKTMPGRADFREKRDLMTLGFSGTEVAGSAHGYLI